MTPSGSLSALCLASVLILALAMGLGLARADGPDAARIPFPDGVRVAHALGRINRTVYTNSIDALKLNYERGYRWFEVDLSLTADGDLVCFHELHEKHIGLNVRINTASTKEFLSRKYKERYRLITFKQLLEQMQERRDLILITDTKDLTPEILSALEAEIAAVDPKLRSRIVLQMYQAKDLATILKAEARAGLFGGIIFTLYKTPISDSELLTFVKGSPDLAWITMSTKRFNPTLAADLHKIGGRVFVHTVNRPKEITAFVADGADGIYTDGPMPGRKKE